MTSHGIVWHHMASCDFIWHHNGIIWHHMASYGIIWHRMTSYDIIWHHMTSYGIIRHHMASYGIIFQLRPALHFASSFDISDIYGTFRYLWHVQLFMVRPASPWGRKPWGRHKEWRCGTVKILPIISTLTAKINFDIVLVLGLCALHGTFPPSHFHPHGKTISFMYFGRLFFSSGRLYFERPAFFGRF